MEATFFLKKTNSVEVAVKVDVLDSYTKVETGKCFVMCKPFATPKYNGVAVGWTRVYTKKEAGIYYTYDYFGNSEDDFESVLENPRVLEMWDSEDGCVAFNEKDKHLFEQYSQYDSYCLREKTGELVEVGYILTFKEYIDILEASSKYKDIYLGFWYNQEMVEIAQSWNWEGVIYDGMDISELDEVRSWFEHQAVCAIVDYEEGCGGLIEFGDYYRNDSIDDPIHQVLCQCKPNTRRD